MLLQFAFLVTVPPSPSSLFPRMATPSLSTYGFSDTHGDSWVVKNSHLLSAFPIQPWGMGVDLNTDCLAITHHMDTKCISVSNPGTSHCSFCLENLSEHVPTYSPSLTDQINAGAELSAFLKCQVRLYPLLIFLTCIHFL